MSKRRSVIILLAAAIILVFGAAGVLASPDYSVEVADRTEFEEATLADGAIVQYIGDLNTTYGASGSGVFNPFVRLQGNEKKTPDERGYNTDGTREFDTKAGTWTHSILLSEIPTVLVNGGVYWEFWSDINDSDSTPLISLDDFELYLSTNPSLTGYPFVGTATMIYDYTAGNNGHYVLINDVNQGSGRGDLRYLVPVSDTGAANCNYGNPACTTYLVLYSVWGGKGAPYGFDGGFEEWKVKKYPILQVSKDIHGAYDTPVTWTITKDFDATYDLLAGDSVTHGYEVSVDPILGAPENTKVYGTITILGDDNDPVDASIADYFNGTPAAISSCSVPMNMDGTYTIAAGATATCSYELALGAPVDGTNLARASYDFDAVSLAFQGSAGILAGDYVETLTGKPNIDVIDTNGEAWSASANSATWTYTRDFTCSADPDDYTDGTYTFYNYNVATISQTGQSEDATVTVNCYAPVVEKTTETYWNRDWDWTIVKAYDGDYDLFAGDSVTHDYKVSVTPTYIDNYWGVKGNIYVYNDHPSTDMILSSVSDLAGGFAATVDCPSLTVPSGGMLTCKYDTGGQDYLGNPFGDTNIATAVFAGANWTGQKAITFSATPTTENEPVITVDDDNLTGEMWSADRAYAEWTYTRDFSCPTDLSLYTDGVLVLADHVNTATILETTQFDTATVEVTCYALLVSKDADTSFTRTYAWTIDKYVNQPGPITLAPGGSVDLNYTVMVDLAAGYPVDSDWAVNGAITIDNPAPMDANLSSVSDVIDGSINASVACSSYTVGKEGSVICTYSAGVADGIDGTQTSNEATATLTNGMSFSDSETIDFSDAAADITYKDEQIVVTDTYLDSIGEVYNWTANALSDTLPKYFTYFRTATADPFFCGTFTLYNKATYTTNDSGTIGFDEVSVTIEVPCQGCTPGFWQGGAGSLLWNDPPVDDQWPGGLGQPFYRDTVFNVFFNDPTDENNNGSTDVDFRLGTQTMWQLVSNEGGIANSAEKAARTMVAAYLNESAFPNTFPADSLLALRILWYNAVAGGDSALEQFHTDVNAWNSPDPPGYCPLP